MKIVWERDAAYPLILIARIAYDHGPITQTGLRESNLEFNPGGLKREFQSSE